MTTLASKIETDFITAYKAKDALRLSVLRMLKTALKNQQVELKRELNDDEILDVIAKQAKQRQDAIDQFTQANRQDLADKEADELVILKEYLPEALSADELAQAIDAAIAEVGAQGMQDMGKVMQAIMQQYKGRVDGKALSGQVRQRLSS